MGGRQNGERGGVRCVKQEMRTVYGYRAAD